MSTSLWLFKMSIILLIDMDIDGQIDKLCPSPPLLVNHFEEITKLISLHKLDRTVIVASITH